MRVKTLRAQRGMTQAELANKTRLSRGYIARLEIGRHEPTLSTLRKLAKVLKVTLPELLE